MKKKLFQWILILALCVILIPALTTQADAATVAEGTCGDNLTWVLDDAGTLTISGSGEMSSNGWSAYAEQIKAVQIGDGVTSICEDAFVFCHNLGPVTVPASVTYIGEGAFYACSNISSITFEGDAPAMGIEMLGVVLTEGRYPVNNETWTEDVLRDYGGIVTWVPYDPENPDTEPDTGDSPAVSGTCGEGVTWTFDGNGTLTISGQGPMADFTWYNENRTVSDSAPAPWRAHRPAIERVVIEDGVTAIGEYAFFGCVNLTEIAVPDSVSDIGKEAFRYCFALSSIAIPNGVTAIEDGTFEECYALAQVTIPNSVTFIGEDAFIYCMELTEITIPEKVTYIGDYSFFYCFALQDITFRGDAPAIGEYAFEFITATAYYPEGNETWTEDVMQNYGGEITWVAYSNNAAQIGDKVYETVAEALADATSGQTVTLTADTAEGFVVIPSGVTLDLGKHSLTADYLICFNGSKLNAGRYGTSGYGKLFVDKDKLILPEEAVVNGNYRVIPYWDAAEGCYVLANMRIVDNGEDQGLTVDEEAKSIYFQFGFQAGSSALKQYLKDGMADNAMNVILRLEWTNENGVAYQDFVYNEDQVMKIAAGGSDFNFLLTGYDILNIDLSSLRVTAMVVTDSGAVVPGYTWGTSGTI